MFLRNVAPSSRTILCCNLNDRVTLNGNHRQIQRSQELFALGEWLRIQTFRPTTVMLLQNIYKLHRTLAVYGFIWNFTQKSWHYHANASVVSHSLHCTASHFPLLAGSLPCKVAAMSRQQHTLPAAVPGHCCHFKFKLSYDWRSVGQSVLVSGHHFESATNYSFAQRKLSSNVCESGIYSYKCYLALPVLSLSGPSPASYCLSFENGLPFYRLWRPLRLRWRYFNPHSCNGNSSSFCSLGTYHPENMYSPSFAFNTAIT
jgi:hypothetical protein